MKASPAIAREAKVVASPWDDSRSDLVRLRQERVLDLVDELALPAGARALHIGPEQLELGAELLARGFSVLGLASSVESVDAARQAHTANFPDAEFGVGDPEALDLEDQSFDLIVADDAIGKLAHDRWALQEMRRVLKPGGHLVLSAANRPAPRSLLRSLLSSGSSVEYSRAGESEAGRSYWAPLLIRGLTELGYETPHAVSCGFSPFGDELQRLADGGMPTLFDWLGASSVILCRRRVVPDVVAKRWIFTAAADRIGRFELTRKVDILRRAGHYGERPDLSEARPVPLERRAGRPDNVLVIAPLPGDELVGCGGTLLALRDRGAELAILASPEGDAAEAETVAQALGADRYPMSNADELALQIDKLNPQLIFVPVRYDQRPERAAASRLLESALSQMGWERTAIRIAEYEVESLVPANAFTDIDGHMSRKLRLLLEYHGAMRERDLAGHCRVANSYHAHRVQGRKGFCECFHAHSADRFLEYYSR